MPPFPEVFKEIFRQLFVPVFSRPRGRRKIWLRVVEAGAVLFALLIISTFNPEPAVKAKMSLTSQGRWRTVPVTNYGPFLTPNPRPDGWNGWLLSDTLEEFLLLGRELHYLSQGEKKQERLNCRLPKILGIWERKSSRKYLLGCEPREVGAMFYFLVFRQQDEAWALEHLER